MPGEATIVTLSRPNWLAGDAQDRPQHDAGVLFGGHTTACRRETISSVRSRNFATSTPMIAAGTRPKSDSAE